MIEIIGHNDILSFFKKALARKRLHHAYLFVGRAGLGKRAVALSIAARALDVEQEKLTIDPDVFYLSRQPDENTGKTPKQIGVEDVHRLRHFLQGKPLLHTKKIAIIDDAHLLSRGAMNALLKTLEEPRGDTTIFLIVEDESALLPTIFSRCQTWYFYPIDPIAIETYLIEHERIDREIAARMAQLCAGIPGKAIRWVEMPETYEWYAAQIDRCRSLLGKPFATQLQMVEDIFAKKDDHIAGRDTLIAMLDIWHLVLRDQYFEGWGIATRRYTVPESDFSSQYDIVNAYQEIERAKRDLLRNIHPRLLIEQVLLAVSYCL